MNNPPKKVSFATTPWETVYMVANASEYVPDDVPKYQKFKNSYTKYYQTFGGGPEGGYFIKQWFNGNGEAEKPQIWKVRRSWGETFTLKRLYSAEGYEFRTNSDGQSEICLTKKRKIYVYQQPPSFKYVTER